MMKRMMIVIMLMRVIGMVTMEMVAKTIIITIRIEGAT